MMRSKVAAAGLLVALSCFVHGAAAQTAGDSERAEKLFADATTLAGKGDFAAACPKFEESQKLDPALGTQFNLALCQEKIGRLASAWRNFRAVERLAHATGKKGREDAAHQKVVELQPRVAAFAFKVRDADATLKVDGQRVEADEVAFYAVASGEHDVEATAPAKKPWKTRVRANATGVVAVDVPALEVAKGETRVVTVTTETTNKKRTIAFAALGVGVVGVGAAAVTGVMLLHDKSTADKKCTPVCADDDGAQAVSQGKTLLPINAVAWGVAAVGLGVGTFLLITSGSSDASTPTAAARIVPIVAPNRAGAGILGSF